ncbi:hypothetical protein GH733_017913 [Mirounga leonina]|nr:hypothetical protein GH733_017913 [Mirounga leonina]
MGISEEEPPSALLEGLGFELELSGLHFVLSTLLHARPEVFLSDETKCVFLGHPEPLFSEQTDIVRTCCDPLVIAATVKDAVLVGHSPAPILAFRAPLLQTRTWLCPGSSPGFPHWPHLTPAATTKACFSLIPPPYPPTRNKQPSASGG